MTEERLEQLRRLYARGQLDPTAMLTEARLAAMTAEELGVVIDILEAMHALELEELQQFRAAMDAHMTEHHIEPCSTEIDIVEILREDKSIEDFDAEMLEIRRAVDNGSFAIKDMIETMTADFSDMDGEDFEISYQTVALVIRSGMTRIESLRQMLAEKTAAEAAAETTPVAEESAADDADADDDGSNDDNDDIDDNDDNDGEAGDDADGRGGNRGTDTADGSDE